MAKGCRRQNVLSNKTVKKLCSLDVAVAWNRHANVVRAAKFLDSIEAELRLNSPVNSVVVREDEASHACPDSDNADESAYDDGLAETIVVESAPEGVDAKKKKRNKKRKRPCRWA